MNLAERTIRLHTFCSVKGGVGKSTLATSAAKYIAQKNRTPIFFDCDLSGTSIADGMKLLAPEVQMIDDVVNVLGEPTKRYLSHPQTEEARRTRRTKKVKDGLTKDRPYTLPYVNDALNYAFAVRRRADVPRKAPRTDAMLWRHEKDDGVRYFPSSSLFYDVQAAMCWFLKDPFDFGYALMHVVNAAVESIPDATDVILDLPPGIYGFPHEALAIAATIEVGELFAEDLPQWVEGPIQWAINPILVTSQDPNDYVPALEFLMLRQEDLYSLRAVINKVSSNNVNALKLAAKTKLGPMLEDAKVEDKYFTTMPFDEELSKIFIDGDLDTKKIKAPLGDALRLEAK